MECNSKSLRWIYLISFLCWSVLHAHSLQQGVTCASFKALTPATVRRLTPLVCLLISFSLPEADLMKQPFLAGLSYWCPGRSKFDLWRCWKLLFDEVLCWARSSTWWSWRKGVSLEKGWLDELACRRKQWQALLASVEWGKTMCLLAQLQSADSCSSCRMAWWS